MSLDGLLIAAPFAVILAALIGALVWLLLQCMDE